MQVTVGGMRLQRLGAHDRPRSRTPVSEDLVVAADHAARDALPELRDAARAQAVDVPPVEVGVRERRDRLEERVVAPADGAVDLDCRWHEDVELVREVGVEL